MAAPPKGTEGIKLTAKEVHLLICVFQNFQGAEQRVDHARLAAAAGIPTPKAAALAWWRLRKKLELGSGDAGPDGAADTPTKGPGKAKSGKRKAAALPAKAESGGEDDASGCVASQSKSKGSKKAKTIKDEPSSDDGCSHDVDDSV